MTPGPTAMTRMLCRATSRASPMVSVLTAPLVEAYAADPESGIAVDTHVFRVSQRLGLAKSDDPEKVHDQLSQVIPKPRWTFFTHLLTTHGRRVCMARTPACPTCPVRALCPWPGKTPK